MTTSEANKIKKELLAASGAAKASVCRMMMSDLHTYTHTYYPEEYLNRFCQLVSDADFDGAIQLLHDKMLPDVKKKDIVHYNSELTCIKVELTLTYDLKPNYQEIIDQALAKSNFYGILKFLNKHISGGYRLKYLGDLVYVMEEILKRPSDEISPHVKHCMFHLFSKLTTSRDYGKLAKHSIKPYFLYFQEKYHCFDETDKREASMLQLTARQNDFKDDWQQFFNPQGPTGSKRVTINDIKAMLDQMDEAHADLVHYLFMCNYIDYSHYHFRDEWMIDAYVSTYNAYFKEGFQYLHAVNSYVIEVLEEWLKDANHKYQKAKKDLQFWMEYSMLEFRPSLGDEIEKIWQKVCNSEDERVIAEALLPYPLKILEMIEAGYYEDAAANVYFILEHLAIAFQAHEDWFDCLWSGGEQTMIVDLVEILQEVYCHLRQKEDIPKRVKNEMDIHLEIFNKKTWFFGIDCGDSRYDDMLLDGRKQYGDYSDLNQSVFWTEWYLPKLRGEFKIVTDFSECPS